MRIQAAAGGARPRAAYLAAPGQRRLPPAGQGDKLADACRDFEAQLVRLLLSEMRKTIPQPSLVGSGFAARMSQEMFDEELARGLARGQGVGVAEMLYQRLADLGGEHHDTAKLPRVREALRGSGSVEMPGVYRGGGSGLPGGRGAPGGQP